MVVATPRKGCAMIGSEGWLTGGGPKSKGVALPEKITKLVCYLRLKRSRQVGNRGLSF